MRLIKNFIKINQRVCNKIEKILSYTKPDITENYSKTVAEYANKQKNAVIIDFGGGRNTPFVNFLDPKLNHKLIIVDNSEEELINNTGADQAIISDLNMKLPLKPNSADLIVSRYVFEHLDNLPDFISNSSKILKTGGYSIHLFSCKLAIFAILNQLIPDKLSKKLLNSFVPASEHLRGFKTSYNYCYHDAVVNIFIKSGFSIEKIYVSFYGSRYFRFFLPFYLISVIYEIILQILGLKNLCAYILIIAKKG